MLIMAVWPANTPDLNLVYYRICVSVNTKHEFSLRSRCCSVTNAGMNASTACWIMRLIVAKKTSKAYISAEDGYSVHVPVMLFA